MRQREKAVEEPSTPSGEEKGWFRRREKSSSRELDRTSEERQHSERPRWFRRREKSSVRKSEDSEYQKQGSDRRKHRKETSVTSSSVTTTVTTDTLNPKNDLRPRSTSDQTITQERLRVPEPTVRRLSSPELENCGVITASLKIPVPLQQQPVPLEFSKDSNIPYIEDSSLSEEARAKRREVNTANNSRQRTGSNDSFLGQPITGTMSFQPLSKKDGDKQSHDSVLSSSSADVYTLSPSPRNTPSSDFLYASGTSSPLSGAGSPPMWLSPDSGTPGLSPPGSPPPQVRRTRRREDQSTTQPGPLSHSATHTFGSKPPNYRRTRERSGSRGASGLVPIGRSRTTDALKVERFLTEVASSNDSEGYSKTGRRGSKEEAPRVVRGTSRELTGRRMIRKRYTGERHTTGHLPELGTPTKEDAPLPGADGSSQLWKRWEIIASDPTEPETFV